MNKKEGERNSEMIKYKEKEREYEELNEELKAHIQ